MTTQLLDTDQVAKALGISKQTLAVMRIAGTSPVFVKVGRRVLFDPADVSDFIASHKHSRTSDHRV